MSVTGERRDESRGGLDDVNRPEWRMHDSAVRVRSYAQWNNAFSSRVSRPDDSASQHRDVDDVVGTCVAVFAYLASPVRGDLAKNGCRTSADRNYRGSEDCACEALLFANVLSEGDHGRNTGEVARVIATCSAKRCY